MQIRVHVVSHKLTRHVMRAFTRVTDDVSAEALLAVVPKFIEVESYDSAQPMTVHVPRAALELRALDTGDDVLLSPMKYVITDTLDQLSQPPDNVNNINLTANELTVITSAANKKAWFVIEKANYRHVDRGITNNSGTLNVRLSHPGPPFTCLVLVEDHQPFFKNFT